MDPAQAQQLAAELEVEMMADMYKRYICYANCSSYCLCGLL